MAMENLDRRSALVLGSGAVRMQRIARVEEQDEVAVFLCSERASYITGHAMPVDGGMAATDSFGN